MKLRILLPILALTVVTWAQTATQPTNPAPSQGTVATSSDAKAQCPCCQKAADGKAEMACCAHHGKAATGEKEAMSCCKGKDSMACMKSKQDESASAASTSEKCCGRDQKGCCGKSEKGGEQVTMACCNGAGGQCGKDHEHNHGDMNK
ncbi:MAG: hypothetical protein LAO09_21070 [Acidobacteriia bacterium]|nr:hypothetical protein [Terriglobia bacterium]